MLFLWRDKERSNEDQDADGEVINLKLAKHRNGPTGEVQLYFKKRQTRFVSYAGERFAEAGLACVAKQLVEVPVGAPAAAAASPRIPVAPVSAPRRVAHASNSPAWQDGTRLTDQRVSISPA